MAEIKGKISTESYKGVRDFYPKDLFVEKYLFRVMAQVAESFGYQEYSASVLEPSELYEVKSGEEIISEQTYSFLDRGGRAVTLRPEMTPTVARMVAARKRGLSFPLRWYSIPNLFRYERPQRGRLREHWQLNADIFGVAVLEAEIEIISLVYTILTKFGAKNDQFTIKLNSRKLLDRLYSYYSLSADEVRGLSKLIDRKEKIAVAEFKSGLGALLHEKSGVASILFNFFHENNLDNLPEKIRSCDERKELDDLVMRLGALGISNVVVDTSIVRGLDYYTGIVFEVFDTDPKNNRALFGGGRYDDLLEIFGADSVPSVGFGMGDVTMHDFLQTHKLMPTYKSTTHLFIAILEGGVLPFAQELARGLRKEGLNVIVHPTDKKVGDQIKLADKGLVPYFLCVGDDEKQSGMFKVKDLTTGEETKMSGKDIARFIKSA